MKILAIDTSSNNFSLAVSDGNKILTSRNVILNKVLEDSIVPTIDQSLRQAKLNLAKIDGFAAGLGPGSFTSLRVGLATIKALSFATGKPAVGISSLDVLAMNAKAEGPICAVIDARRDMVYACIYEKGKAGLIRRSEYLLVSPEDLLKNIKPETNFIGNGIELLKRGQTPFLNSKKGSDPFFTFEPPERWNPKASVLAQLALARFKSNKTDDVNQLVPLYLYPQDCQVQEK